MAAELSPRQQRFVDEYAVDCNATQAAIRAGYSPRTAKQQGARLLTNADVRSAVQELLDARAERTQVTQDRVIAELAKIAFSDLTDFASWSEDGELNVVPSANLSPEAAAAIREVYSTTSTVTFQDGGERSTVYKKLKAHDKLKALELLGRHLGMFKKDVEVRVTGGLSLLADLFGDEDGGGDEDGRDAA